MTLANLRIESAINGLESRTLGTLTTDHVTIDGASSRGLWLLAGAPTLDTVAVANVAGTGIRIEVSASPTLTRCVVRCRNACIEAACGDGVVRDGVEECDDGNVAPGDGCSPGCRSEFTPPDAGPGGPWGDRWGDRARARRWRLLRDLGPEHGGEPAADRAGAAAGAPPPPGPLTALSRRTCWRRSRTGSGRRS